MFRIIAQYLKPDKKFKDVTEIEFSVLKEEGVKGIILDLDDTLVPSDKKISHQIIENWVINAKKEFSLFVLSNNIKPEYVGKFCKQFDIPFIARATKPRSKFIYTALEKMNLNKKDVVIVGDRITTDILAGKMIGMKAFLVSPLTEMPSKLQKVIYSFESYVLKKIENV